MWYSSGVIRAFLSCSHAQRLERVFALAYPEHAQLIKQYTLDVTARTDRTFTQQHMAFTLYWKRCLTRYVSRCSCLIHLCSAHTQNSSKSQTGHTCMTQTDKDAVAGSCHGGMHCSEDKPACAAAGRPQRVGSGQRQ